MSNRIYSGPEERKSAKEDWPKVKTAIFWSVLIWGCGILALGFIGWILHKKIIFWIVKWVLAFCMLLWCAAMLLPIFFSVGKFFLNHYSEDWREEKK